MEQAIEIIQKDVFDEYHFILITERMDESLAVMQLLFGFERTDLIVLSSKRKSNGSHYYAHWDGACHKISSSFSSNQDGETVQTFLEEDFPRRNNNYDFLLYAAANRSLDLTIDALGRDLVERTLQELRHLRELAENRCQEKAIFPCSQDGTYQIEKSNCYDRDWGCGHACVDQISANEDRN